MALFSVGFYKHICQSKIEYADIHEVADFLQSYRDKNERMYIKIHDRKGTRYIRYKELRQRIMEATGRGMYMQHIAKTINY